MIRGVTAVALVTALIVSTGSAMAHPRKAGTSTVSALTSSAGPTGQVSDVVCVGLGYAYGAVLSGGRDPDSFVRGSLLREYAAAGAYPGQAPPGGRCESSR